MDTSGASWMPDPAGSDVRLGTCPTLLLALSQPSSQVLQVCAPPAAPSQESALLGAQGEINSGYGIPESFRVEKPSVIIKSSHQQAPPPWSPLCPQLPLAASIQSLKCLLWNSDFSMISNNFILVHILVLLKWAGDTFFCKT